MSAGLKERDGLENEIINLLKNRGLYTLNDILKHVKDHDKIKESPSERAKKDKIRRIISKSPKIEQTLGRTKRKRYHLSEPGISWDIAHIAEVMLHNELLGGHSGLEDVAKQIFDKFSSQGKIWQNEDGHLVPDFGFNRYESEKETEYWIPPPEFEEYKAEYLSNISRYDDWITYDVSIDSGIFVKTKPSCWFENEQWLPNSYFGFRSPSMLNEIITNISSRLEQITDEEIKDSNVKSEIEWLNSMKKSRKRRHSNKYIFTLAILHLNRSLLGSNMAEL